MSASNQIVTANKLAGRRNNDGGFRDRWFPAAFWTLIIVQGVHVVEHVIQLAQVYLFAVPDDDALGLLGLVFEFQGTEEWLHLVFNSIYLASLVLIAVGLITRAGPLGVPLWALLTFWIAGVGLEAWHMVEHGVIISGVIANDGCPCPGILDVRLGTTDTVLHFFYNAITYAGAVAPFVYAVRTWRHTRPTPHIQLDA